MTSRGRAPHLEISRSFETERIASHRIALSFLVPPFAFADLYMQRDASLRRCQRQDHDQIRRAGVKEINREHEYWPAAALFPATSRMEIGEPDFAPVWIGHAVSNTIA